MKIPKEYYDEVARISEMYDHLRRHSNLLFVEGSEAFEILGFQSLKKLKEEIEFYKNLPEGLKQKLLVTPGFTGVNELEAECDRILKEKI